VTIADGLPIAITGYGITRPKGYGALGSLADHEGAEFAALRHPPDRLRPVSTTGNGGTIGPVRQLISR